MTDRIKTYGILIGSNTERNDLRDLGVKGKELIKQISKKLAKGVSWILLITRIIHTFLRIY